MGQNILIENVPIRYPEVITLSGAEILLPDEQIQVVVNKPDGVFLVGFASLNGLKTANAFFVNIRSVESPTVNALRKYIEQDFIYGAVNGTCAVEAIMGVSEIKTFKPVKIELISKFMLPVKTKTCQNINYSR